MLVQKSHNQYVHFLLTSLSPCRELMGPSRMASSSQQSPSTLLNIRTDDELNSIKARTSFGRTYWSTAVLSTCLLLHHARHADSQYMDSPWYGIRRGEE